MSTDTYVPAVIADLESRAGASDQDREAWLAERRQGITATQVRDIVLESMGLPSWSKKQELIDEKLGRRTDDFTGSPYTDWGNEREPVVADMLAGEGFAAETRVFHHPGNSRYLASPDGIRVDFDEQLDVLEIKTAKHDLPPGSEEIRRKGYELQVQWVMFVLGAQRCRFVVEERLGQPSSGFEPGALHRHWIERDEVVIARLVEVADAFLAELDRQRVEGGPVIDEHVDTLAVNYLRAIAEEKQWAALKKQSYGALLEAGVSQTSALAKVTYTPGTPADELEEDVVDLETAAAAHPKETAALARAKKRVEKLQAEWDALANQHTKTVRTVTKGKAARVTVTAVKQTEEKAA